MTRRLVEADLQKWMPTSKFVSALAKISSETDGAEFFQRKYKFAQENRLASAVARKFRAQQVRLSPQVKHGSDFEIISRNGRRLCFQATEVIRPGRKRRDEHAGWAKSEHLPVIFVQGKSVSAQLALKWLQEAASKKAEIPYQDMTLLIYVNLDIDDSVAFEAGIADSVSTARSAFNSIWVLWGKRLYRCWPQPWSELNEAGRSMPHELGRAVQYYRSKQALDALYNR